MAIVVQCAGCGRRYRMPNALAGKQAKCRCGEVLRVPGPAGASFPPRKGGLAKKGGPSAAKTRPRSKPTTDAVSAPGPPVGPSESRERQEKKAVPLRTIVAVLSIVYGGVMALAFLVGLLFQGSLGLSGLWSAWSALTRAGIAGMIVAGGVLMLKGHEHGRACAGLACLILCFFPLWSVLAGSPPARPGQSTEFLLLLLRSAVVYSIPVFVAVWCLREELAKEEDSEEMD